MNNTTFNPFNQKPTSFNPFDEKPLNLSFMKTKSKFTKPIEPLTKDKQNLKLIKRDDNEYH